MEFFKFLQPKIKSEEKTVNESYEQEEKEWLKNCEKELDEQAEKIVAEPNDDEIYKFEEKLNTYINTKEKEIKDEIRILEKDLPMFRGRAGAMPEQNETELRIGRRRAALDLGITRGDIKYNYLKKAGILSDEVENFENNLKVPSLNKFDNIVDDHLHELQSGFEEGMKEKEEEAKKNGKGFIEERIDVKGEKKAINDQLRYIWTSAEIEKSNLSDEEKSMLKAAYSRNYKIDPMMVHEFEGTVKQIKKFGISENDIKNADPEIFNEAEEILKENDPKKKKNFIMKHGKKAITMFIVAGLVLGIADSLDDDIDLASNYQYPGLDQDEEDENVSEETAPDSAATTTGSGETKEVSEEKTEKSSTSFGQASTAETSADDQAKDPVKKDFEDKKLMQEELKTGENTKDEILANDIRSDMPSEEKMKQAIVGKGEGVSHAVMRQLIGADKTEAQLEAGQFKVDKDHLEKMGYEGNINNKAEIVEWARSEAGDIVTDEDYHNKKTNKETWVMGEDKSAYVLHGDKDSGFHIAEHHDRNKDGEFDIGEMELENKDSRDIDKPFEKEHEINKIKTSINEKLDDLEHQIGSGEGSDSKIDEFEYKPVDLKEGNDLPYNLEIRSVDYHGDGHVDKIFLVHKDSEPNFDDDQNIYSVTLDKNYNVDDAIADIRETIKDREDDFGEIVGYEITPTDAQRAGINIFDKDKVSWSDREKLEFWQNSGIFLPTDSLAVKKVFDIADAHGIDSGGYARIADNLKTIEDSGFSQNKKDVLKEIFFADLKGDKADAALREFFGKDNYKGIEDRFKNARSIDIDKQGNTVISLDQARLVPNWIDQLKIIIGRDGSISMKKPGLDVKLTELNKASLDNITKEIYSFIQKDMPKVSEGVVETNTIVEDDEPAAKTEKATEEEIKTAPEIPSSEELSEKDGVEEEAVKEFSEEQIEEVVKDMDKKLTSKEKELLKNSQNNPKLSEKARKIVQPLISISMGGDGKKILWKSTANHMIGRFFEYLSEKDSEKGKTEEVDLTGKSKDNKEEIAM